MQSVNAGFLGLLLCWVGFTCEGTRILMAMEEGDLVLGWNIWNIVGMLLKGYIEGLTVLGVLAGVVKVVYFQSIRLHTNNVKVARNE